MLVFCDVMNELTIARCVTSQRYAVNLAQTISKTADVRVASQVGEDGCEKTNARLLLFVEERLVVDRIIGVLVSELVHHCGASR